MAPSFVSNSLPDASDILAIAIQTLIQLAPNTSPSEAVIECAQILKAAQESPFGGKIPDIGNKATANKIQVLAFNAGKANSILSEMVAVITKASRHFGTFCDEYAEVTEGLQRQGSGTAGLQLYLELEIVDSRAVRPTAVLTTATATVPGPTSLLPAVASALAGSSVTGVRVPVTSGLGGVSASLPPASVSSSVPLNDVFGIVSTGLPSISIPGGLTSSTLSLPGRANLFPTATNAGATTVAPTGALSTGALPATRPSIFGPIKTATAPATTRTEDKGDDERTPRAATRPAPPAVQLPLAPKPVIHAYDVFGPIVSTTTINPSIRSERLDKIVPAKRVGYQDSPNAGQSQRKKRASVWVPTIRWYIPSNCDSPRCRVH